MEASCVRVDARRPLTIETTRAVTACVVAAAKKVDCQLDCYCEDFRCKFNC